MEKKFIYPKISIVTVVYNGEKEIENTLLTVIEQDYPNLEHIIIDGASTDGTIEIINKYNKHFSKIISEPDVNMYDGMNKGILHANGEWINFMNCGDRFTEKDVITKLFTDQNLDDVDLIYGDSLADYGSAGRRRLNVNNKLPFWKRYICHQSIFVRTKHLKNNLFNLELGPSADYDSLVRLYFTNHNFKYYNLPVSTRSGYGFSDKNRHIAAKMNLSVIKEYISLRKAYSFYLKQIISFYIKYLIKLLLPKGIQRSIRKSLSD